MCGRCGVDAVTMVGVMAILASYYPWRVIVRDERASGSEDDFGRFFEGVGGSSWTLGFLE